MEPANQGSAEQPRRKGIWCDFGGVLTPPVAVTVAAFCARVGTTPQVLITAMTAVARRHGTDDLMEPLDTPLVTEHEWADQMEAEILERFAVSVRLSNFSEMWFGDRAPNTELVEYLRADRGRGFFVGMLSNMPPTWDALWRKMVPPEGLFDDIVMSFQVGTRKPQREIYDLSAARAGVVPGDCVLIDDLEKNCGGARDAGWHAILYKNNSDTIAQLEEFTRH